MHEPIDLYLAGYRVRRLEERLLDSYEQGHLHGTVHTCIGQELTGFAVCAHLIERDVVISNHRCHGHYMARFGDARGLLSEILGRGSGLCGGHGGSQHLHRDGFFSSGIQAGMAPAAAGLALARKREGEGIVVYFLGDGTLGEGVVYETFNLAALHRLPVLFVCEDNGCAQSSEQSEYLAGHLIDRPKAFGIEVDEARTAAPEELGTIAERAVHSVRTRGAPRFLHVETFRLGPHSKGDDSRASSVLTAARERDPLCRFLRDHGDTPTVHGRLRAIDAEIDHLFEELLAEPEAATIVGDLPRIAAAESRPIALADETQRAAINGALSDALGADPDLVLLGEDLRDPYGGAFKITQGLSSLFPDRVFNMPISEAGLVGMGLGLALAGHRAVVEIMFGDFVALAFDQLLNHVAKSRRMYGRILPVPLLVRTPMGGNRGYGATHSQSLEKLLWGIPDLEVVLLHPRVEPRRLYATLLREQSPTVVVEHKLLYACTPAAPLPPGSVLCADPNATFTRLRPHEADITVCAFGGVGVVAEAAANELVAEEIGLDVFFPCRLSAFPGDELIESLNATSRLCLIEEGTTTGGLASEGLRRIVTHPKLRRAPTVRIVGAADRPIPAARSLETQVLPTQTRLVAELLALFDA